MGSGYARLRCARRPFRNDAPAARLTPGFPRRPHASGPTPATRRFRGRAPPPGSSRAKPERSGGADPGPIPRSSTGSGRGRAPAPPDRRGRRCGMGSGYARRRCARRTFRNDAAAARHPGPKEAPASTTPRCPVAAAPPRRHPGTRFERSEDPRIRDPFRARRCGATAGVSGHQCVTPHCRIARRLPYGFRAGFASGCYSCHKCLLTGSRLRNGREPIR